MRKGLFKLVILGAAVAVLGSAGGPALAAPGGGEVDGQVFITNHGGIPVAGAACIPTTFKFESTVLNGTFFGLTGSFTAVANGGDPGGENANGNCHGPGVVASAEVKGNGLDCFLSGTYTRNVTNVQVNLNNDNTVGPCTLNGNPEPNRADPVILDAEFIPTNGDGVLNPITQATFVGGFETAQ